MEICTACGNGIKAGEQSFELDINITENVPGGLGFITSRRKHEKLCVKCYSVFTKAISDMLD